MKSVNLLIEQSDLIDSLPDNELHRLLDISVLFMSSSSQDELAIALSSGEFDEPLTPAGKTMKRNLLNRLAGMP